MAKTSSPRLRKQISSVKGHEYTRWVVDFGKVNGKRKRETFKTKAKANRAVEKWQGVQDREAEKQKILATRIGEKAEKLTTDDLLDATKAIEILKRRVPLETAAQFYIAHNSPLREELTVQELYDSYLLSRQLAKRRPDTLRQANLIAELDVHNSTGCHEGRTARRSAEVLLPASRLNSTRWLARTDDIRCLSPFSEGRPCHNCHVATCPVSRWTVGLRSSSHRLLHVGSQHHAAQMTFLTAREIMGFSVQPCAKR